MQKPSNYAETPTQGEFTPVELGGHKMVIKQVSEKQSNTGKPMIVVLFDFDKSDSQPDYFMESFKNDIRPDKKWSNQATQYILTVDTDGNCSKSFKTFCTCVEKSNAGFSCWKADNTFNFEGIKGKKVGGVFGEQMDFYNGEEKKKRVLRWFCSLDKVADAQVPEITETKAYKERNNGATGAGSDGFMNIPYGIDDEELPFN